MKLCEITMKYGDVDVDCYRIRVDDVPIEIADNFAKEIGFEDFKELQDSGYDGMFEIECDYKKYEGCCDGDVCLLYYMDDYKLVKNCTVEEIEQMGLNEYLKENGMMVPDNTDLGLGDSEWYDLAYPNKEEMEYGEE